jgi:chromosome segregation ATPase
MDENLIQTGVDRLLIVIKKHKKISVSDSAKLLGVSLSIAEEWGKFLEDEGYIRKEYKFTKAYFVLKTIDNETLQDKAHDINQKKSTFINKSEIALTSLDSDNKVIGSLRKQFELLKNDISTELDTMKVDFQQFEKYELLKSNIDKHLKDVETSFKNRINQINNEIKSSQEKYQHLLNKISSEAKNLEKQKEDTISLKESENELRLKLNEFVNFMSQIKELLKKNETEVKTTENKIKSFEKQSKKLATNIIASKSKIDKILEDNKKYEEEIIKSQKELFAKLKNQESSLLQGQKDVSKDRFKDFFNKKNEVEQLLKNVEDEKILLEKELLNLIRSAKAFKVSNNNEEVARQITDLENNHIQTEKKRKSYEEKMNKLATAIGIDINKERKKGFFAQFK